MTTQPKYETVSDVLKERNALRRWKSTNAPRIEALEGLLSAARMEAAAGREAIATLASERAANALLTDEIERHAKQLQRWADRCDDLADHTDDHTRASLRDMAAEMRPNA